MRRTEEERERLEKRYRGSGPKLWEKAIWGFGWEEPTELLIERGIMANPQTIMNSLRRRGLLREIEGKTPNYFIPHPEVVEESIRRFEQRLREEKEKWVSSESAENELREVRKMDDEFHDAVREIAVYRLDDAVKFGRSFSVRQLADYLKGMFPKLYFDTLLSLVHQCALSDVEIVAPTGKVTNYTGFNLSFFGPSGSGKTFNIDDMVRGNKRLGVPPHGLPGRNRYCGGITPVQFIRIGEAYKGRKFNFIVPEFNDFFKYKGMVEPLKLVMEQREVKYETTEGTIGPYKCSSFFAVNYNTQTVGEGYRVTISDPNFNAIEDRMLCRLHKMSKERFAAIDESRVRLELGELQFDMAERIRDHLALVYAIETGHPLFEGKFKYKAIAVTREVYDRFTKANEVILNELSTINFSTRLGSRAIRLACAMSLLDYFSNEKDQIALNQEAVNYALRFYVEEVSARSQGRLDVEKVLKKLGSKV